MNQLTTFNQSSDDGHTSRRYGGFPLNSTLVSYFTPDTIRSIISHAATGKPYTTAVWIRMSRVGIQISAQDPQVARTRIPVFIPLGLIHDIFMQPTINNVICIVYDEVKSNMKGVLLYVVHPADAHLLRDDFRQMKSLFTTKGIPIAGIENGGSGENTRLISPNSQKMIDVYRNGRTNRFPSPKRIVYNRDVTPTSAPTSLPQLSYSPMKSSYHSNRDDSGHRRHRSPKKNKIDQSSSNAYHDDELIHQEKYQSRSSPIANTTPPRKSTPEISVESGRQEEPVSPQQQEQIAAWQAVQTMPVIPMGLYNRYIPKAIPLPTGETIKTTLPSSPTNGHAIVHIEPHSNGVSNGKHRSPSRSRSISSKRQDPQINRHRSSSAQNADASGNVVQSSHYHQHHRHHHHHHHHQNGGSHGSSRGDSQKYGTISHPTRKRSSYLPINKTAPTVDREDEMKKYLKQLIDDMQAIKMEMNQMRQTSHPNSMHGRSDSLRVNLKELRHDIDSIRARIALAPKIA